MRKRSGTLLAAAVLWSAGCGSGTERDAAERMDMPDSMPVMRAMENDSMMDEMLDTMPGGEMARGDTAASMKLLKKKM